MPRVKTRYDDGGKKIWFARYLTQQYGYLGIERLMNKGYIERCPDNSNGSSQQSYRELKELPIPGGDWSSRDEGQGHENNDKQGESEYDSSSEPQSQGKKEQEQIEKHVIEITEPGGEKQEHDGNLQHYLAPLVLKILNARMHNGQHIPLMLVGEPASGKSYLPYSISRMLKLPFESISVSEQTSKIDLFGYKTADGEYVDTGTYRIFKDGGILMYDEMDAASAGVMTMANMLLANGLCGFPNGMVKKHESFRFVGTANTYSSGADLEFVGRQQLDGATRDRFAFLEFPIDESLEAKVMGLKKTRKPSFKMDKGGIISAQEWHDYVKLVRKAIKALRTIRHIVGRSAYYGDALLKEGIGLDHVKDMTLWRGCEPETRDKIENWIEVHKPEVKNTLIGLKGADGAIPAKPDEATKVLLKEAVIMLKRYDSEWTDKAATDEITRRFNNDYADISDEYIRANEIANVIGRLLNKKEKKENG